MCRAEKSDKGRGYLAVQVLFSTFWSLCLHVCSTVAGESSFIAFELAYF